MSDRRPDSLPDDVASVWCGDASWCPVAATASLLGKKWHTVVLVLLLQNQPCRFSELNEAIDEIADKTLADALANLEEAGLVGRTVFTQKPVRIQYSLTERGEALEPIIEEMNAWGTEYLETAGDSEDGDSEG